jgi:MFS transporter, FHS family, L-fucose permease
MNHSTDNAPLQASSGGSALSFGLVTSLFFAWGFLTCMNDILIPFLKNAFALSLFQATLVQFAFFLAYSVGSALYFYISATKGDPIARIGYQNGIVFGLFLSGIGALLFYPAGALLSYPLFLAALFILALGFTMLQISANPYVTVLGSENTASSRLNLSQGFNSLGTTLAPLIGGSLILGGSQIGTEAVRLPYLVFAGALFALGIVFLLIRLPKISFGQDKEGGDNAKSAAGALRYPHVRFGMLAIFCYVGAEVSVGSLLISYFKLDEIAGLSEEKASVYVAIYWGGLMIGRFLGAISMGIGLSGLQKALLMAGTAVAAFLLIGLAVHTKDNSFGWAELWPFSLLVALNYGAFFFGKGLPARTLMLFAGFCIALLLVSISSSGPLAMWSVIGVGLFNSIMWSNIFSLAIAGLGTYKSQASSLLVMMIMGGALLPPAQGFTADLIGVQASFLLPVLAYLYLAWYGFTGYQMRPMGTHG